MQSERKGKFKLDKQEVDLGFKVLKLSRSNYQAWQDYDGEDVKKLETLFDNTTSPLVDDWQPQAVRTEIMLLEGFPLDSAVTVQEAFKKNKVMLIESDMVAHRLFVCLDKSIKDDTIQSLELRAEDVFVCLDSALSDEDKVRLSDMGNLRVI
jgi:adenine-specific DNA-methyltransferase